MAHNQEHKTFIYNFALIYNSLPVQRRAIIVTIMLTKGGGTLMKASAETHIEVGSERLALEEC